MTKKRLTAKEIQDSIIKLLDDTKGTVEGEILKEFYDMQTKCIKGIIKDDLEEITSFAKGYSQMKRTRR